MKNTIYAVPLYSSPPSSSTSTFAMNSSSISSGGKGHAYYLTDYGIIAFNKMYEHIQIALQNKNNEVDDQ
ncbi:hypothetical protein BRE01_67250 [Brevibacillus reuszeri]|uniref:Uncharacterized protein n=1 Tax=Brevibacillus reuszeri TaxID=54915 RepID=A0ABQ0U2Q0_9BACL|nr:hypothetical protein BRE01_67250 [Brevibacillus reuszeri]